MTAPRRLLGDIGATNARFAIVGASGALSHPRVLACADYPAIEAAIADYLRAEGQKVPREAALAVASPTVGDQVTLTNHPWSFSISGLQRDLGLKRLLVINDFTANALAIPHLGAGDRMPVGGGTADPGSPVAIIGPGSGLGVSGLVPRPGGWTPLAGEGGHATMAPADPREGAVLDLMRRRFDHVSAERVLSGPGLVNLYNALAELDGVPAASYSAPQITDASIWEVEPLCREAVMMFCAMLGTIAGNLALFLGARGGVYVAGGIVPKLGPTFAESPFRERFEAKGRFRPYLAAIPTWVITHPVPAFLGLAGLLAAGAEGAAAPST
jgi:glucokinase